MNNIVGIQSMGIYLFTYLFRWWQRLPCEVQCSSTKGKFFCLIVQRQGWMFTEGICVVNSVKWLPWSLTLGDPWEQVLSAASSALHSAWHSGWDPYIFIQSTSKIILSRGENINPKHISLLSWALLPSLCFGKKPNTYGNKIFCPK